MQMPFQYHNITTESLSRLSHPLDKRSEWRKSALTRTEIISVRHAMSQRRIAAFHPQHSTPSTIPDLYSGFKIYSISTICFFVFFLFKRSRFPLDVVLMTFISLEIWWLWRHMIYHWASPHVLWRWEEESSWKRPPPSLLPCTQEVFSSKPNQTSSHQLHEIPRVPPLRAFQSNPSFL